MRYSIALTAAFAGLAIAAPAPQVQKRETTIDDCDILNYALTLEYLERAFYRQGIANYTKEDFAEAHITGIDDTFYNNLLVIRGDEETHVDFLSTAITAAKCPNGPVLEATYTFPSTNAMSFAGLSSVLEGVGVSAYLGAAADIMDKTYLTAAGSILTVESRHSAYIRANIKQTPFPSAFDTPLGLNEVFTLASPFIAAFDPTDKASVMLASKLMAFPKLTIPAADEGEFTSSTPVKFFDGIMNQIVENSKGSIDIGTPIYAAFFSGIMGPYIVGTVPVEGGNLMVTSIPEAAIGQVYVVLTTTNNATLVGDDTIVAGPGIIEVGPQVTSE